MFHRFTFFAISLFFATASSAQIVGGTISGTVLDPAGAVVPGAHVTVRNQEIGSERHLITDAAGVYVAPSIPVGIYSISVARDGFAPQARTDVSITVGQAMHINLTLQPGGVTEQVTVTDAPNSVNFSTQQTSGLVSERQVKDLPLNGRSYDQLITLNPAAVNYTAQRSEVGGDYQFIGRQHVRNLRSPPTRQSLPSERR